MPDFGLSSKFGPSKVLNLSSVTTVDGGYDFSILWSTRMDDKMDPIGEVQTIT